MRPVTRGSMGRATAWLRTPRSKLRGACRSRAGVLAKLDDVALRVDAITHRDAVEGPLPRGWLHDSAVRPGDCSQTREAGHEEDRLECCRSASSGRGGDVTCRSGTARDPMYHQLESR